MSEPSNEESNRQGEGALGPSTVPIGTLISGKYEIERLIGVGTTSMVYQARQRDLERSVAVKVLSHTASESPILHQRAVQEARSVAALAHPHIVKIFSHGEYQERPFIAMEYLPGRTLHQRVREGSAFPLGEVWRVMAQLLDGLEHAHENEIVHRDLSPANVFLEVTERRRRVVIVDFGLCRRAGDPSERRLTTPGKAIGTRLYSAPEQLLGVDVGPRADIYGAGVLLYYMLTGRTVLDPGSNKSPLAQVLEDSPRAPSELRSELKSDVDALVARAMAKDPKARFASCKEFASACRVVAATQLYLSDAPPAE